jgi:hypothetical protein
VIVAIAPNGRLIVVEKQFKQFVRCS